MALAVNENTFRKYEKLTEKVFIDRLFSKGKTLACKNFRLIFFEHAQDDIAPVRLLISVPKKRFKHAVERNRVKRLIREAYRLNKSSLIAHYETQQLKCHLAIIYTGSDIIDFESTQQLLCLLFKKLMHRKT